MNPWSPDVEEELALVLKDWLKQQGRTQADLRRSLRATSTRMPALMQVLEMEHRLGGLPRVAAKLCSIEADWINNAPAHALARRSHPHAGLDESCSTGTHNEYW